MNFRRVSLLWKIWLSTSVALTGLFVLLGLFLQRTVQEAATRSLQEEVQASAKSYDALWQARADSLRSVAAVLTVVPRDPGLRNATSVQAATLLWLRVSKQLRETAFFQLADEQGEIIAARFGDKGAVPEIGPLMAGAESQFPQQATGFYVHQSALYQVVLTPLYSDTANKLSGVLIAGFHVDHMVAEQLRRATGKSEFIFAARGQIFASTLDDNATGAVVRNLVRGGATSELVSDGVNEYVPLLRELKGMRGETVGQLLILRSFADARESLGGLRQRIAIAWAIAVFAGLFLTYLAVKRIIKPVRHLDEAASQVALQNYDYRLSVDSDDELGRLANTFNKMCESLQAARGELIRRERIATIGRLASSIVHDLRNPLAAIYSGSELLVDTEPTEQQTRRIAENIYRSSRRIQELLDDLVRVSRGRIHRGEPNHVRELILSALGPLEVVAQQQNVHIRIDVPAEVEVPVDRTRMEGVFYNLAQNALEVMPDGGYLVFRAEVDAHNVLLEISDTGPGIPHEIRAQLFQPFISHGKKNGLGLGLALARQTVLDHGGDLWATSEDGRGARFYLRLPRQQRAVGAA